MSHFAVLVITEKEPSHEVLAAALQPFHEYECTGVDDQYVVDVDVTDEVEAGWAAPAKVVRLADGSVVSRWSETLYHPTGEVEFGTPKTEFRLPEGAEEFELPLKDSGEYESIDQYADQYGGWKRGSDGRFFKHTNPNAEWDWWQLGGRYNGRLFVKSGAQSIKGTGGLMTPVSPTGADAARRGDLDFTAMYAGKKAERRSWADEVRTGAAGLSDAEIERGIHLKASFHEQWMQLPEPRPRGAGYAEWMGTLGSDGELASKVRNASFYLPPLKDGQTLAQWIDAAPAISAWAVLKDGQWTEKGSMGWWGMASDEKDDAEWENTVSKLVEELPPDQWVSVVDCHI